MQQKTKKFKFLWFSWKWEKFCVRCWGSQDEISDQTFSRLCAVCLQFDLKVLWQECRFAVKPNQRKKRRIEIKKSSDGCEPETSSQGSELELVGQEMKWTLLTTRHLFFFRGFEQKKTETVHFSIGFVFLQSVQSLDWWLRSQATNLGLSLTLCV